PRRASGLRRANDGRYAASRSASAKDRRGDRGEPGGDIGGEAKRCPTRVDVRIPLDDEPVVAPVDTRRNDDRPSGTLVARALQGRTVDSGRPPWARREVRGILENWRTADGVGSNGMHHATTGCAKTAIRSALACSVIPEIRTPICSTPCASTRCTLSPNVPVTSPRDSTDHFFPSDLLS